MIAQEPLRDLTETYLGSLISEVSECVKSDIHPFAAFGELGIDSFRVLKMIRKLEMEFGPLPKSLLFEHFTIHDLATYFISKHTQTLSAKFSGELAVNGSSTHTTGRPSRAAVDTHPAASKLEPICILETEALKHSELRELVGSLSDGYKMEGSVSRGTRKIAPNLFIGSARTGYFNYGRSKNIILVYGYTGPQDHLPALLKEMHQYCVSRGFQLNTLADVGIKEIGGIAFSATPFGVLQRISNLKEFTLEGGAMRRLRYQVAKFAKAGVCRTEEYRCGSNPKTDKNIGDIIDKWCQARTMVNPLVHDVKGEILAGTLRSEHRLFLTYLDNVLQNVILIAAMSSSEKSYLMDLEFYPADMPMGGLEFAITQLIEVLVAEGCDALSLGGTYGCKLEPSVNPDPEIEKILDDLRRQNIFNDEGNLQFKNKFRPENKTIFLCRPVDAGNPDNVVDIIMMIADPEKMQTSDEENHTFGRVGTDVATLVEGQPASVSMPSEARPAVYERMVVEENGRSRTLADFGFNPLNIPHEFVELDLKTDSWAQLRMPSIEAQMNNLHAQLQQSGSVDASVRAVFPFAHFVLTASGQDAEHLFFKAWLKKGLVLQNLLFPSTLFHQIDQGFTGKELPHPAVFDLNSREPYKGNLDWEALQLQVAHDPAAIAFVCIEVSNNAAGGCPVSMRHLREVKALLTGHGIPLVMDGTRVVENAQFLIEQEEECAGQSIWAIVRKMFSYADAVIGSLTKDFCVKKGGIIATNDSKLFLRLQELEQEEGAGTDVIDKKMIALSLQNRTQIETRVLRRMEGVRRIWRALHELNVPIMQPAGGHCVLIDVKQIPEFSGFKYPAASFVAWLYLNTGIRAAAHSVGMQKHTLINDLVRLAIPVGLRHEESDSVIKTLMAAFTQKVNIPELALESGALQPLGGIYASYKLIKYHEVSGGIAAEAGSIAAVAEKLPALPQAVASSFATLPEPSQAPSAGDRPRVESVPEESEATPVAVNVKPLLIQDVAIVGMAGRYPKATNLAQLWENLAQGRDCIEDLPADRYERRLRHGNVEKYRGGFIDDVDRFDSLFFNISPREAEMLDPQERIFLEVVWEAIEDAGYYPEMMAQEDASRNIGVFVGAVWAMYQMLGVEEKNLGNKVVPNSFQWSIANRVSYWFNFCGPSLTLDTACSSSLTAIYLACQAIQSGECSAAVVGGVNLDLHQAKLDINQNGGALSADGVCRSFGKGANGYVAGEGVGALFLKPLDAAVRGGDHIYGVIKGAVVNHGGRTSGYTVPNPKAHTSLISAALEKANIGARSLGYIEAHGTGTELGDPIEIAGLSNAFSADDVENQTCAIGSIKSNIGHLEAAAGIVSVTKVLLQMKHRQLVPSLHSSELNEFIDFENSPFYVVQHLEEWKSKEAGSERQPLRAGISSFGAGGANAHIILESYEPERQANEARAVAGKLMFPLSAKSEDQLRQMAARLGEFLQRNHVDLNDAAYTLQFGRKSFDYRLAIVAGTSEELREKLMFFIAGKKAEGIASGYVKSSEGLTGLLNRTEKEEFTRLLSQSRAPGKLADLWVGGLLGDWSGTRGPGKRVSLPTYPFADKRHWASGKSSIPPSLQRPTGMHPLLDSNESTFERQLFKKTFHDRDFFIHDHLVANTPTLPGVAYLELARRAGEIAAGRKVQKIRNILWVSPIAVHDSKPKEVFIELKASEVTVKFEVFSYDEKGVKVLHSQGTLLYATEQEASAEPEYIDLEAIRARCLPVIDGSQAYPLFKSFGLSLGPSFQVLQQVYKNDREVLGALKLPEFRQGDLDAMVLHPSLVDGSLQAGMSAQLGDKAEEMFVPFSIGEVEILHPLQPDCFSYVTEVKEDKKGRKGNARLVKSNVLIVDQAGKVLVKINESIGVPLRDVHRKLAQDEDVYSRLCYLYEWEKAALPAHAGSGGPHSMVLFDTEETLRGLYQARLTQAGWGSEQVILVSPGEEFQDLGKQSYKINPRNKNDFTKLFETLIEKQSAVVNICFAWPAADCRDEDSLKGSLERGVSSFLYLCQALIKQKLESKVQLLYLYSVKPGEVQPQNEAMAGFVNTLHLEHPKLLCKVLEIRQESAWPVQSENLSTPQFGEPRGALQISPLRYAPVEMTNCSPHSDSGVDYEQILAAVWAECQAHTQDATAVRYDGQERSTKRLKAFDLDEAAGAPQGGCIKEKGVYLITGGTGGLGLIFAEYLAREYQARLILTGRTMLPPEREAKLKELRKLGAEVFYQRADVSRYEDVKNLIYESKARFGQINGIIHAAGVLSDSLIRHKTAEEMSAVFAPKVFGTLHLDELTKNEELDFFVTFSSLAAVAGNGGQCDYSFANHFMDSFVAERELFRAQGTRYGKALSINWSLWANGGMKPDEQTELYFKKTLGMKPLDTRVGIDAFVKGLASEKSQFAVLEGVREKAEIALGLKRKDKEMALSTPAPGFVPAATTPLVDENANDLLDWLVSSLSQKVMNFLKLDASDVLPDKILLDLGFDSIGLTTFANEINDMYQLDITPVLFFEYPSIDEIAKYLSTERRTEVLRAYPVSTTSSGTVPAENRSPETQQRATAGIQKGWDPKATAREAEPVSSERSVSPELRFVNMPIAIVGMSGVMPQSEDLGEFWENLKNSKDMVTVIPEDRWHWADYYGDPQKEVNKSNSKWGGFMKEVDKFDPLFFGISPREAHTMDPQQRIFLETVWKAIEDSGQKVSDLSGTRTGLFVGVATNDYIDVMNRRKTALDGYSASGNSHSVLANRVSFLLNLRGPSAPIDTACSSSLVALHRAIESIHTGSCDMAIVGGVQVMLSPAAYISFAMAGMLSDDGKCKTFDKRANGYVRGEGCGAIFLKTLSTAEADGNHIYAVIKATAENHGGRVTTLTAPNPAAQTELLIEAYDKAQIDPTTVGYIECHGTGTSLGDPIEIQALSKAFSELYKRANKAPAETPHCGLSSVKTNIGHLETAAGMAGILKALLAIKHKQIPANIHFEEVNPYIHLKGTPFYIADKLTPWQAAKDAQGSLVPRRAGVSSFGFGGANAHIVLEEYVPRKRPSVAEGQGPQMIVLSAKNEDRLKAYAQSMHEYLQKEDVSLVDLAYTLQMGRDEMPERLALIVSSIEDLKRKIVTILDGVDRPEGTYRNHIRNTEPKLKASEVAEREKLVRVFIEQEELSKLAELWISGVKIDWRLLYRGDVPNRIAAPTYPFARERYWIPGAAGQSSAERQEDGRSVTASLHPLVHRNISTLQEQRFGSRFSGEEFYFRDHVVGTQKVLPGVAYLEMARAAGELSGSEQVRLIRNVTWERPLIAGSDPEEIQISLTPVKNTVRFSVKASGENPGIYCTGTLGYSLDAPEPDRLNIAEIRSRCSEQVLSGSDLYLFLSSSGLNLGKSFQIVQTIFANESESLAILQLPEPLKAEATQFCLHPALMDGSLHTAIGLMKANGMDLPLSIPYSVGEVQIFHSLEDLHYGYATWGVENPQANQDRLKVNFQLLDKDGVVLVRIKDYVARPSQRTQIKAVPQERLEQPKSAARQEEGEGRLQSLVPVWNRVHFEIRNAPAEWSVILLFGQNPNQLDWVRKSYPNSQLLDLDLHSDIEVIERKLGNRFFDQLLWIAPDINPGPGSESGDGERIIAEQEEGVLALFRILKALQRLGYATKKLEWTIVTSNTHRVIENDRIHPAHAAVAGLVGSMAKEYPQWDLRLLDLDSLASVSAQECLSLPWDKQGNTLAHRHGEWLEQGLELLPAIPQGTPVYRPNGVHVVIGGAGGLGEVWTRFMMDRYQANVVWLGRRPYDAAIEEKINSLTRMGRAPLYISADAANLPALEQARETILTKYPAIHGIVHSAMVLHDESLARLEEPGFRTSLQAKVDISVNMDKVFGKQKLDFMLFFSSIVSFFKTPGQANYAAGCTFKDSFAQRLQQQRAYPVKIMNWGYWGSVGVAADELHRNLMEQTGIGSIEPEEGMASLQALAGSDVPQMLLIKTVDGESFAGPSLSGLITHTQQRMVKKMAVRTSTAPQSAVAQAENAAVTESNQKTAPLVPATEATEPMTGSYVGQIIIEKLSAALSMDAAMIRHDDPFADYGVDSIIGVNFARTLSETLEIELAATKLFEYSTVTQLTQYISSQWREQLRARLAPPLSTASLFSKPAHEVHAELEAPAEHRFLRGDLLAEPSPVSVVEQRRGSRSFAVEPIAIIGMSGRFAESESLEEFWQNLKEGRDLVTEVSRWSTKDCVRSESNGNKYCSRGSFVDSFDQFDPSFFRISTLEAIYMDPQQRLFLEECWRALEDGGYAGKSVHEKQCGIYIGCGSSSYDRLFADDPPPAAWWGNSQSVAPARIAYYLDLQGPAIAVDTACSSSLVAMHLACQGLWAEETEMALAGGVYLQATSGFHQVANRAGMLSPDGKCYSFDARANGFVPGEGVGVVVLKRLRDALHDGDHIHGVIAGSGINQNGTSNGLIAPNARAQERLERSVYERFQINPEAIQVVEAHGTGTVVGDSIELGAISRAFRRYTEMKQFCAVGSVKTNVGHGASVAGVTSVLKVLLGLKHGQIPPSLHFETGNPAIDFESSPFYVNTQLKAWETGDGVKRRAAVSSFGFSGTNAHMVIEEAPLIERALVESPGYVVVLSARTAEQLKEQVGNLLALLRDTPGLSMNDLSYSLFVGRRHLSHRLSCVARNQEELIRLLDQWSESGAASQVYIAVLQEGKTREQPTLQRFGNYCIQECTSGVTAAGCLEYLATIADLYVQGYSLDFGALFPAGSQRLPLPTYPFARERYWIDTAPVGGPRSRLGPAAVLHPLLHTNTSTFSQQSYRSAFTGTESFLEDRPLVARNQTADQAAEKVLPEAACLEMVRLAMEMASPIAEESSVLELRDTVWADPIVIARNKPVTIALLASEDGETNFEIYAGEPGGENVHCQGKASLSDETTPAAFDISQLQGQMQRASLDRAQVYAEFAKIGVDYGPAHQAITGLYQGESQLLAQLSLPPVVAGSEELPGGYVLHPGLTGALQAATRLIAEEAPRPGVALSPKTLERLRMLAPCKDEMFAWVRHSRGLQQDNLVKLDIDLMDADGNVCVEMRHLSFQGESSAREPASKARWLFSIEQLPSNGSLAPPKVSMGGADKMELFLQQETALQLQKPIENIPTDQSYFDLGMTSLGITHLIQNLNLLLGQNLAPSALFEYPDIQSLALYLAETYPAKVSALMAIRDKEIDKEMKDSPEQQKINSAKLMPFARNRVAPQKMALPSPGYSMDAASKTTSSNQQVVEDVLWHEAYRDEGLEKVSF